MNKLYVHYQNVPGWAAGVRQGRAKLVDPPDRNPLPGTEIIGRTYLQDTESNALVMLGELGAELWFARFQGIYLTRSYVHAWEGPNEPPVATPEQRRALVAFTRRWVQRMHGIGCRTVVLNLSRGWTDIGDAPDLAGALEDADYVGLHEYGCPTMQTDSGWHCLRYRRTVAEWRAAGARRIPPILITECGLDDGQRHGWRTFAKEWNTYRGQLQWYSDEISRDAYVAGAFVFTAGPIGWEDFEVTEEMARETTDPQVHEGAAIVVQPDPVPVPAPNVRLQVLEAAWRARGVPRNAQAAFFRAGQALEMGAPLGPEERCAGYVFQPFAAGVLCCRDGDWGNVECLDWFDSGVLRLVHPVAVAGLRRVTQVWGANQAYYSRFRVGGVALRGHNGLDFGVPAGTEIVACDEGEAVEVLSDPDGYGQYVKLRHAWGESLYAHLSRQLVAVGDRVAGGQPVGRSGNTGNSTGPHLHFAIRLHPYRRDDGWGGYTDPAPYLE